jgi:hypothetical protein
MVQKFNKSHGRSIKGFESRSLAALRLYNWPGNIRELENVIEHAFIIENLDNIRLESLPDHLQGMVRVSRQDTPDAESSADGSITAANDVIAGSLAAASELNYPQLKEKFEREFLIRALKAFNGRINQTAEHTQMTKVTLLRKLEKYGINPKQYHSQ